MPYALLLLKQPLLRTHEGPSMMRIIGLHRPRQHPRPTCDFLQQRYGANQMKKEIIRSQSSLIGLNKIFLIVNCLQSFARIIQQSLEFCFGKEFNSIQYSFIGFMCNNSCLRFYDSVVALLMLISVFIKYSKQASLISRT